MFSVSVEEDLLTWVFPFCKPYLTTRQRRGRMGGGGGWGSGDRKEKIRLLLKNVAYCVVWLLKWIARV